MIAGGGLEGSWSKKKEENGFLWKIKLNTLKSQIKVLVLLKNCFTLKELKLIFQKVNYSAW